MLAPGYPKCSCMQSLAQRLELTDELILSVYGPDELADTWARWAMYTFPGSLLELATLLPEGGGDSRRGDFQVTALRAELDAALRTWVRQIGPTAFEDKVRHLARCGRDCALPAIIAEAHRAAYSSNAIVAMVLDGATEAYRARATRLVLAVLLGQQPNTSQPSELPASSTG